MGFGREVRAREGDAEVALAVLGGALIACAVLLGVRRACRRPRTEAPPPPGWAVGDKCAKTCPADFSFELSADDLKAFVDIGATLWMLARGPASVVAVASGAPVVVVASHSSIPPISPISPIKESEVQLKHASRIRQLPTAPADQDFPPHVQIETETETVQEFRVRNLAFDLQ